MLSNFIESLNLLLLYKNKYWVIKSAYNDHRVRSYLEENT